MAATLSDRLNINAQLEHLQAKYVGTGHADTNKFEWAVNIHRDSYASYVGHPPLLAYFAVAENESIGRVRCGLGCQGGCGRRRGRVGRGCRRAGWTEDGRRAGGECKRQLRLWATMTSCRALSAVQLMGDRA